MVVKRFKPANLRHFLAAADEGSFSGAAKKLGISQPAVSLSIKHMEEEFGVTLFDRSHGRCNLTPDGAFLLDYAREAVRVEDRFYDALGKVKSEIAGTFEVVSSNIPGEYVLPSLIGRFRSSYPKVEVILEVSDSYSVIDTVLSGEMEIGFTGVEPTGDQLESRPVSPDTLVLVASSDHPLARKKRVTRADLQQAAYVMRERQSGTRRIMIDTLERVGVDTGSLEIAMELSSTSSVLSAVASGAGLSMTSCIAADSMLREGRLVVVKRKGLAVDRDLYMVYRRGRSPSRAAEAFLKFVDASRPWLIESAREALIRCREGVQAPG